ncbi:hypothetical protein [Burkholderia ambifaria]|uniref:hypothetical protein n=1 Tax=Burkholderia ambifaria TaxID=152480 RepID=UPI0039E474BF
MSKEQFSDIEHEIIVLYAIWDMIDGMVNFSMFEMLHETVDTNVMFTTSKHAQLFNVLLTDFLSAPSPISKGGPLPFGLPSAPQEATGSERSFLYYLNRVAQAPNFDGNVALLRDTVGSFKQWLDTECIINDVWFGEFNVKMDVRAKRFSLLKICGNIAKHNFSRLERNVADIRRILQRSEVVLDEYQIIRILPTFYDWFHRDFFFYHSSAIAEYLNNIRWAIYSYLQPEFARSYVPPSGGDLRYSYAYPSGCVQPIACGMYWDLMNNLRREPYFPKFSVSPSFKAQY